MRIISGKYKGRKIKIPLDADIRPVMDRVKEWVFSVLGDHVVDAEVCDLFAGSGSFGIEALSRYAKGVVFVDNSPKSCKLIKHTIDQIHLTEPHFITRQNATRYLKQAPTSFDIIFCDPPYDYEKLDELVMLISKQSCLNENGLLIIEHHVTTALPEKIDTFTLIREKKFGKTLISIFGIEHAT